MQTPHWSWRPLSSIRHAFFLAIFILFTNLSVAALPIGSRVGPVQCDAIIEFNAPILRTHVLLFARYWVAPDYYCIAVVWAEPHVTSLNFCTYPITLRIGSDEKRFTVSSQIIGAINREFLKPLGDRGVFCCMFNNYPIADTRFAEREALETRLYAADFAALDPNLVSGWQTVSLKSQGGTAGPSRLAGQVKVRQDAPGYDRIELLSADGTLLKAIQYEYSDSGGRRELCRESVILPETAFRVGFEGEGVRVKSGGQETTISEARSTHHTGTRRCVVEYEPVSFGSDAASLPQSIAVYRGDDGQLLRRARLFGVARGEPNKAAAYRAAREFASLDAHEAKCREFLLKYWLKAATEVDPTDANTLRSLQAHFAEPKIGRDSVGEELKRINMLFQVDWMLGDSERLVTDFAQYLKVLQAQGLNHMVLEGGRYVIETTIRWGQLRVADRLLASWPASAVASCDAEEVLRFARLQIARRRFWTTAKLLERRLATSENSAATRFDAHSMCCVAFCQLREQLLKPEVLKLDTDVMQVGWVSRSMDAEALGAAARTSLAAAERSYRELDEPTDAQRAVCEGLVTVQQRLSEAESAD